MSEQHVAEIRASFERVALDAAYESDLPSAVMAQLSTAISLKRIADAADKLASCISDLDSAPQNELAVFARCKDMMK